MWNCNWVCLLFSYLHIIFFTCFVEITHRSLLVIHIKNNIKHISTRHMIYQLNYFIHTHWRVCNLGNPPACSFCYKYIISDNFPLAFTFIELFMWISFISFMTLNGIPHCCKIFYMYDTWTLPNSFSRSIRCIKLVFKIQFFFYLIFCYHFVHYNIVTIPNVHFLFC